MSSSEAYNFLILGGQFAGTGVAHYLLKHTIPALRALDPSRAYHVTIVSASDAYYYKVGAPRVLVQPELARDDSKTPAFVPLADLFAQYPADAYTIVRGTATAVDPAARTVTVAKSDQSTTAQRYDSLVLATGSTTASPLWAQHGDAAKSRAALAAVHAALPAAKTILLAGGGPVGVESAGELAQHYPGAAITLLSGGERLLQRLSARTSAKAESMLTTAGVKVVHDVRVTDDGGAADGRPATLRLSDGSTRAVDVYLDATGGRPNTAFLPKAWVDERGRVPVDDTLRGTVAGMGARVYAVGDVASNSSMGVIDVVFGVKPVGRSIGQDVAKLLVEEGKASKVSGKALEAAKFAPIRDSQFVPIGSKGGVGQLMGWGLPSFAVWLVKSRDFMFGSAKPRAEGSDYKSV